MNGKDKESNSILVIFGAGASYDFSSDINNRGILPLATELFSDQVLRDVVGTLRGPLRDVIDEYHESLDSNPNLSLEEELSRILSKSETSKHLYEGVFQLRQLIRNIIRNRSNNAVDKTNNSTRANNYRMLLRKLRERQEPTGGKIIIVTFNYDLLIEQSVNDVFGLSMGSSDDMSLYTSDKIVKLYKVHGSIDWRRAIDIKGDLYDVIDKLNKLEKYDIVHTSHSYTHDVPAISVPFKSGKIFELPKTHIDSLTKEIYEGFEQVLTVGWSGQEEHFNTMLEKVETKPKLTIVTPTNPWVVRSHVLKYLKTYTSSDVAGTFHEFVRRRDLASIINR